MAYTKYITPSILPLDKKKKEEGLKGARRWYILSLGLFILALLSKPMAVTLPIVLLILDWHPFDRIRSYKEFQAVFIEKLPFIALSIVLSILTVLAQRSEGALVSTEFTPLGMRLLIGFKSLMAYLWKMILPLQLIPFYPYPRDASLVSLEYLSAIGLVGGITILCIFVAKNQKLWLSAWGYYVITLIPVLGIVQVGLQSMADRYTYLPSIGPFFIMGLLGAWVWERIQRIKKRRFIAKLLALILSLLVIISLLYLTFKQIGIWKNSIVFWSYVIEKEPETVPIAYYNRGIVYQKMELFDKAIADYDKAIALKPSYYEAFYNRGLAFQKIGFLDQAIKDLELATAYKKFSAEEHDNLGNIYSKVGRFDKAVEYYNRAIALDPLYYKAYYNRAIVYEKIVQPESAIESYNKAIAVNPSYYEAHNNLGVLYGNAGLFGMAIEHFSKAILLNQSQAVTYLNRGTLYRRVGNNDLAISDFQKACALGNKAGCGALNALVNGLKK